MSLQDDLNQLKLTLDKAQSVMVVVPDNASADHFAAALGLYLGLLKLGKSASVLSSNKPNQEYDLVGMESIKTSLDGRNLVISFPYDGGSIEKVSYTEEVGRLNIVIEPTGKELKFSKEDVRFSNGGNNVDVIFTLGVSKLEDIGKLYTEQSALFGQIKDSLPTGGASIINIDNGQANTSFGQVNIVNPKLPTVSEIIVLILKNLNVVMDKDIATNLYRGLQLGTNDFSSERVSALTFEAAALTMRSGAGRSMVKAIPQTEVQEQAKVAPVEPAKPATSANDWLKPKIFSPDKN